MRVGSEGFNFCTKYKCEIASPFMDLLNECGFKEKYRRCGNCPYCVYLHVVIVEDGNTVEIKVGGFKKSKK